MRYVGALGLLIALALVVSLSLKQATQLAKGPSSGTAVGAAQRAAGVASEHAQEVLKNQVGGTKP